jgi:hypothetical protein
MGPCPPFQLMSLHHSRSISTVEFNSGGSNFIKRNGYWYLILALHLRAGVSQCTNRRGRHTGPTWWLHRGLTGALLPSSLGHGDAGFSGQNDVGVDEVLTQGKTQQGMAPRWLAVATSIFQAWASTHGGSGALPASRSSPMPFFVAFSCF